METPFNNGTAAPMPGSLWAAVTPAGADHPVFAGETTSDVGIIGAGFMGLTAALKLAQNGNTVSVLEAADVGWGASGRNNGLIAPGLKLDPPDVIRLLGRDAGERLVRFSGEAPRQLFELIENHRIDCDAGNNGWIQPAHSRAANAIIERRLREWQNRGADVMKIPDNEVEERLGTGFYCSAWLDRRGGSLNPLACARGLARAAKSAGANIFRGSPVLEVSRGTSGWKLRSANGTLSCRQVLLCCNAYNQLPPARAAVLPLRTAQIASAPLGDAALGRILPGREAASDTLRLLTSFRITGDRRLIMGGAGATAGDENPDLMRRLRKAAGSRFPFLGELRWDFGWSGYLALTPNHLPAIYRHERGMYSGIGCNGRGVAMATATGGLLADLLCGADPSDSPVPVTSARRFPGYALRRPAVAIGVHLNRALDRCR